MKIYSLAFLILFQLSTITDSHQNLDRSEAKISGVVYKSTDGGKTWNDISEGLPEVVGYKDDGTHLDGFFADDRGLYLSAGNWMYHNQSSSTSSSWSKKILPDNHKLIAPAGKTGILAYSNVNKEFLRNTTGTGKWTITYETFQASRPQTFLETAGGTVFVGTDRRLFRSTDSGKTWSQVDPHGWVLKLTESDGIIMSATTKGIARSSDDGENWEMLNGEEGVGIALEKSGFSAISTRTGIQASYDGGKTWNVLSGLPQNTHISAIVQVGDFLLCSHDNGISRSSDKGKTWTLLRPAADNKLFNLGVSGNVIYAIHRFPGC